MTMRLASDRRQRQLTRRRAIAVVATCLAVIWIADEDQAATTRTSPDILTIPAEEPQP